MVDGGARSALVIITISTIINKEGERTKEEGGRRILKMVNGNHKLLPGRVAPIGPSSDLLVVRHC